MHSYLSYSTIQKFPLEEGSMKKSAVMRITSGAMAGIFASIFTHPMDVVRARLTVQDQSSKAYTGTIILLL